MGRDQGIAESQLGHWWLPNDPNNRIPGSLINFQSGRQEVQLTSMLGYTENEVQWIFVNRFDYRRFVSYRGGSILPTKP